MGKELPRDFDAVHESCEYPYAWQHMTNKFRVVVKQDRSLWTAVIQTAEDDMKLYPYKDTPEEAKSIALTWMNSVGTH